MKEENGENLIEYIDLGRFFELATTKKRYVKVLLLQTYMKLKIKF